MRTSKHRTPRPGVTQPRVVHWLALGSVLMIVALLFGAQGLIQAHRQSRPAVPPTFPRATGTPAPGTPAAGTPAAGTDAAAAPRRDGGGRDVALVLDVSAGSDLARLGRALRERGMSATLVGARSRSGASTAEYRGDATNGLLRRLLSAQGEAVPLTVDLRFDRDDRIVLATATGAAVGRAGSGVTLVDPVSFGPGAGPGCPPSTGGPTALWSRAPSDGPGFDRLLGALDRLRGCGSRIVSLTAAPASAPGSLSGPAAALIGGAAAVVRPGVIWLFAAANLVAMGRVVALVVASLRHHRRVRSTPPTRRRLALAGSSPSTPVTVIVPAYNERECILPALESLVAATSSSSEIIVVDDGSTDGTARRVTEAGLPRVRVIEQPNGGKPTALNTGLEQARHELVVMVDADTIVHPDAIRRLVEAIDASPDVVAVSGNVKVMNRTSLLTHWQHLEYVSGFNLERRLYDTAGFTPTVPGALGIFRRSAVRTAGGLSPATVAEDTDLTLALQRTGLLVTYEPRAVACTEVPATVRQLARQRFRWSYGTMQALWRHRDLLGAPGALGTRARGVYAYFVVFQILMPMLSPLADVIGGYLWITDPSAAAIGYLVVSLAQIGLSALALRLDREGYRALFALPLLPFFYRPFLYLVVLHSLAVACSGLPVRWQPMARLGAAGAMPSRWQPAPPAPVVPPVPMTEPVPVAPVARAA